MLNRQGDGENGFTGTMTIVLDLSDIEAGASDINTGGPGVPGGGPPLP